ncbi:MAG: glycosyltransferase family 2 protein [Hyphomicrobiaceae bacterium]|nr:glycosyltransferase family 2 protein [Hyphomicrobiaceae bacterium]
MTYKSSVSPARRVSVVLVAHNSADVIGAAIASIDADAEIIVVDNASNDKLTQVVARSQVRLIRNSENLGYGTACNIGASAASRDFILFMNPDARLRSGALDKLVCAAISHENIAAFNPRIINASGDAFQRRHSRLFDRAQNKRLRRPLLADCEIEMVTGAVLFCRKAHFDAVGGFDERIFLYFEDDDLAIRFKLAGFTLGYVHEAIAEHEQGHSTPSSLALEYFRAFHFMRSMRYARQKHGLGFNLHYRQALAATNWLLASITRNGRRKQKYAAYLEALGSPGK